MGKPAEEKKEDKSYLLALALLLLSAFFLFLFFLNETEKGSGPIAGKLDPKEFEYKVNNHLFNTSQSIEMSQEKMRMETDPLAARGIGPKATPKQELHRLDFSNDPRSEALLKELGREAAESGRPSTADEVVQTDLFEAQQYQELSEAYKKEYARQFIENARKAGYIIKLNDDYKVISVKAIRKPAENMELFPSNGHGVQ